MLGNGCLFGSLELIMITIAPMLKLRRKHKVDADKI
jgi:hypothetical protein